VPTLLRDPTHWELAYGRAYCLGKCTLVGRRNLPLAARAIHHQPKARRPAYPLSNTLRGRNPSHRQVVSRMTSEDRRWQGVPSQLPKMLVGIVLLAWWVGGHCALNSKQCGWSRWRTSGVRSGTDVPKQPLELVMWVSFSLPGPVAPFWKSIGCRHPAGTLSLGRSALVQLDSRSSHRAGDGE
jgi:hypothetical protein